MATSAELLAAVETAISTRLSGGAVASYAVGSNNLRYMELPDLVAFRDKLKAEVSAQLGGVRNYGSFRRPG